MSRTLENLIEEYEQRLKPAGAEEYPFHVCTPYVGLDNPGEKIVLIGLHKNATSDYVKTCPCRKRFIARIFHP